MFEDVVTVDELFEEKQRIKDSNTLLEIKKENLQNSVNYLKDRRDSLYTEFRNLLDQIEQAEKTSVKTNKTDDRNLFSKLFSRIF